MSGEGYLRKARDTQPPPTTQSRPQSFSERLASARQEDTLSAERKERVQKVRTKTFDIGQAEIERYKEAAVDIQEEAPKIQQFSREDVLAAKAAGSSSGAGLPKSQTAPSLTTAGDRGANISEKNGPGEEDSAAFESYSGFHLTRRNLPHTVLHRHMKGKAAYGISNLLQEIKGPDYELPDIESDIVVFGIVASKSDPQSHKKGAYSDEAPKKFMVITLVDLKWEIQLYLFNSGFERFWKLTEGTVVAILNPDIMPPKKGMEHTGKFSLVISSDMDTIIELGRSRDLGYCQSVKKDGQLCGSWVNKKRTHYCEWHTAEAVNKTKGGRVEMNNAVMPWKRKKDGRGEGSAYEPRWKEKYGGGGQGKGKGNANGKSYQYDRNSGSNYFMARSMSAADLIDGKDITNNDRMERAAALKRRLIKQEEERAIASRLEKRGDGAGKEYMRARAEKQENIPPLSSSRARQKGATAAESGAPVGRSAAELKLHAGTRGGGLPASDSLPSLFLGRDRDRKIELGPMKRKRADSASGVSSSSRSSTLTRGTVTSSTSRGATSATAGASSSFGWGGNLRDKLARMKQGEKLRREEQIPKAVPVRRGESVAETRGSSSGSMSPAKKKTRFVTEKGIREAGRDSLGGGLAGRRIAFDDEEDELEII